MVRHMSWPIVFTLPAYPRRMNALFHYSTLARIFGYDVSAIFALNYGNLKIAYQVFTKNSYS